MSGGGRPRGKSDCGIPITQRKELGSYSLGSARGTEECYLKGEWCGQVSNLGKALGRLPGGNEPGDREEASSSDPTNVFILAALGLSRLMAPVERLLTLRQSAELEAELIPRNLLFPFIGGPAAFS